MTANVPPTPDASTSSRRPSLVIPGSMNCLTCATPLSGSGSSLSQSASLSGSVSSDIIVVGDLLATMKLTLSALGATFDSLGEQTAKVASLGPAVEARNQIAVLRTELQNQIACQEARMDEAQKLLDNVLKEDLSEHLKTRAYAMIQEIVQKEVKERVRAQLEVHIPNQLRQQVKTHKRQILEVQTSLHNSEARRYNATLRSTSLTTPLRPLLRPLPASAQSPVRVSAASSNALVPPTPVVPDGPTPTPISTVASGGITSVEVGSAVHLEPPTPSPLFPRDLGSLFKLSPGDASTLVKEYGLEGHATPPSATEEVKSSPVASPATTTPTNKNKDKKKNKSKETPEDPGDIESRELNLNRFMAHIGVPFLMVPTPLSKSSKGTSSQGARKLLPPLITSISPK